MEVNPSIITAVQASVGLHFKAHVDMPQLIEAQKTPDELAPRYEIRIDGPYIRFFNSVIEYRFEINALITTTVNQESLYGLEAAIAEVVKGFSQAIVILDVKSSSFLAAWEGMQNNSVDINFESDDLYYGAEPLNIGGATGFGVSDLKQLQDYRIGCLNMAFEGRRDRIEISRFGKIQKDTELYQGSIEAHYKYEQ